jgi:hypothetical protein
MASELIKVDGSDGGGDEEIISVSSSNKAIMIEIICINTSRKSKYSLREQKKSDLT